MSWLFAIFVFCGTFSSISAAAKKFRWCTVSADEETKCNEFVKALPVLATIAGVEITPRCVAGTDDEDCMKKIKNNEADLVTFDGGKVYQAGKGYNLVPIVAEDHGPPTGVSYYAVAVARKDTDVTFNTLKGKKSCHTGYRKTAGWNIPIGSLLEEKMKKTGCDAQSAAAFFSKSCVPGAPKVDGLENLCKLCPGCPTAGHYTGYHGAFKCMADKKGDVAFVKHLTTAEVVKDDAAKYGSISDYKYLCVDGSTKVVTNTSHLNCNLASNPSHAVVARPGDNTDFIMVLHLVSRFCQPANTASFCNGFLIFNSSKYVAGKKDLLFKDSTKKLVGIDDYKQTYDKWLGYEYTKAMKALGKTTCIAPPSTTTNAPPNTTTNAPPNTTSTAPPNTTSTAPPNARTTSLNPLPGLVLVTMAIIAKALV